MALSFNKLKAQDSLKLYLGLYTAGTIEQYSKYITKPYYKDLNYYTISFIPKIGVQFRHITLGLMGSYTFHKNTLESEPSLWGGGYFLRYNFLKKQGKRKIKFDYFVEWRHLITDGYYIPVADWRRTKIEVPVTYLSIQAGLEIRLFKSFSLAPSAGLGSTNFLKNPQDANSDRRLSIKPYGTLTIQYHLKL